jgi:hypothetical protein
MPKNIWELRKGDILLGTLTLNDVDMFWLYCSFIPTPAFEPFKPFFTQEYRLLDTEGVTDAWVSVYAQITSLRLSLTIKGTFDLENIVLLHIVDDEAWFRSLNDSLSGWVAD